MPKPPPIFFYIIFVLDLIIRQFFKNINIFSADFIIFQKYAESYLLERSTSPDMLLDQFLYSKSRIQNSATTMLKAIWTFWFKPCVTPLFKFKKTSTIITMMIIINTMFWHICLSFHHVHLEQYVYKASCNKYCKTSAIFIDYSGFLIFVIVNQYRNRQQ